MNSISSPFASNTQLLEQVLDPTERKPRQIAALSRSACLRMNLTPPPLRSVIGVRFNTETNSKQRSGGKTKVGAERVKKERMESKK